MYQIVAAQSKYSEEEVRERLSTVYPTWDIEGMDLSDRGWLVRLKKNAEFPFDEDKEDSKDDSSDAPKDSEDSKDDSEDDSENKPKDAEEDSKDDDSDSDIDASDGLDEGEAKDLVGQLNDLQGQLNKLVEELGGKAQEVAEDAKAKDDKIKEIADSVKEVAPADDMAGLDEMPMDGPMDGPPMDGPKPPMAPKRPPVPSPKKRPPVPGGGINTFTKRKVEVVTHPGTDHTGAKISLLTAAREIETVDQWKDYEVMSMTQNVDGSFSAKLRLK